MNHLVEIVDFWSVLRAPRLEHEIFVDLILDIYNQKNEASYVL